MEKGKNNEVVTIFLSMKTIKIQNILLPSGQNKGGNHTKSQFERKSVEWILCTVEIIFRRGKVVSVRVYWGIWVLACIPLCGATSAHRSELHFFQARRAIHRGERNSCAQTYTHIPCMHNGYTLALSHTHVCIYTLTQLLYMLVFPPAISTALQPN